MNETTPPSPPPHGSAPGDEPGDERGAQPGNAPHNAPGAFDRFFSWLRGLGIVRGDDRWFAGVAGGIAAKAGIDPLIVRGIFVVLAIVSGSGILLYLAGWLLLPDRGGRIHLEELFRGRASAGVIVAAVTVGVLVIIPALIGLFAAVLGGPGRWDVWDAWGVWGFSTPGWIGVVLTVLWWLFVTGLIIWGIVWLATGRKGGTGRGGAGTAPDAAPDAAPGAAPDPPPAAAPAPDPSTAPWSSGFAERSRAFADRAEETASRIGEQANGWGEQLGDWGRQTREEARQWREFGQEHHRSHRLGAAHVVITLALALLAAGGAALWALSLTADRDAVLTAGLVSAVAVLALSMIVAGIRGRDSGWIGFLSFVGVIALVFAPFSTVLPDRAQFVPFGGYAHGAADDDPDSALVMIGGSSTFDLTGLTPEAVPRDIEVWVLGGNVSVKLPDAVPAIVQADLVAGSVRDARSAEDRSQSGVFVSRSIASGIRGAADAEIVHVRVRLFAGYVRVEGGLAADASPAAEEPLSAEELRERLEAAEQRLSDQQTRFEEERKRVDELKEELEGAR